MGLEETLTDDEIKDFKIFDKVCSTHNQRKVYDLMCEDMISRHQYKGYDELIDRYLIFSEQYRGLRD